MSLLLKKIDESELNELLKSIRPLDDKAMAEAKERQDYRLKVPESLGALEDISIRLAGVTGRPYGNMTDNQAVILMCADNGVVEEGVASAPQTVTLMQTVNFPKYITGVGSQAKYFGIDILDIDVGVKLPIQEELLSDYIIDGDSELSKKIVNRRIRNGTNNFVKEPAMSREDAFCAIGVGIEAVKATVDAGKNIIGIGEMGIGNTTTSAAIICRLTGISPEDAVGRGGGLDDEGLKKKTQVVAKALELYGDKDPIDYAICAGGLDILAMTGAYIGAAIYRIPVVIDGIISIAAALLAAEIAPGVKDFMFASHRSKEKGYIAAVEKLGLEPMFDLRMKLGEGSGCPIAFKIMEASCAVINEMKSLDEGQIDSAYLDSLREEHLF